MAAGVVPSGKSKVASTPSGSAPIAARSLHTTWTASRPAPVAAVVIGSVVKTQAQSASIARAAASTPSAAPINVSGRLAPRRPSTSSRKSSGGSFPVPSGWLDSEEGVRALQQLGQARQEGGRWRAIDDAMVETQRERAHGACFDLAIDHD